MSAKKTVKVIKKGQLKRQEKVESNVNSARQTAREMVQTVTNWVNDLQQKRRTETANSLKFLSDTPRPSEVQQIKLVSTSLKEINQQSNGMGTDSAVPFTPRNMP